MRFQITLHGLAKEFVDALNAGEKSKIIEDMIFNFLQQDKKEIVAFLTKYKGSKGALALYENLIGKESNTSSLKADSTNSQQSNKQELDQKPKQTSVYEEEGSISLNTLTENFSMTSN